MRSGVLYIFSEQILLYLCILEKLHYFMTTPVEVLKAKPLCLMSYEAFSSLVLEPKCCVLRPVQDAWAFQLPWQEALEELLDDIIRTLVKN